MLEEAVRFVLRAWPNARPACGLILGSGWGEVADAFERIGELSYSDIPGLGRTGVAGHAGRVVWARSARIETLIFQGRRHFYEGAGWTPVAVPVYLLKSLGARLLILTNAAGGIRGDLTPGTLMLVDDHINHMGSNPLIGPHQDAWGPRFLDLSAVYDPILREVFRRAAEAAGLTLTHGVYLAASGPTYETPSEIWAYRTLGADAVGMSTVPEAVLAHAAGMKVAALSCISNLAAGLSDHPLSHEEVAATAAAVLPQMTTLLLQVWKELYIEAAVARR